MVLISNRTDTFYELFLELKGFLVDSFELKYFFISIENNGSNTRTLVRWNALMERQEKVDEICHSQTLPNSSFVSKNTENILFLWTDDSCAIWDSAEMTVSNNRHRSFILDSFLFP